MILWNIIGAAKSRPRRDAKKYKAWCDRTGKAAMHRRGPRPTQAAINIMRQKPYQGGEQDGGQKTDRPEQDQRTV